MEQNREPRNKPTLISSIPIEAGRMYNGEKTVSSINIMGKIG